MLSQARWDELWWGQGEVGTAQDLEGAMPSAERSSRGQWQYFTSLYPGLKKVVFSVLYTFRIFAWPFKLAGQFGTQPLTEYPVSVCVCS